MILGNLAISGSPGNESGSELYEILVEVFVVEEDPIVVIVPVKSILNLTNRLDDIPKV